MTHNLPYFSLLFSILAAGFCLNLVHGNINPVEGRYSFSLSTFSPDGKIGQLSYATLAASNGHPILIVQTEKYRIMASLQNLSSPIIEDDGTARFVKITDTILLGHTGIAADGRILADSAQQLAVEHAYTFDEEIPINILLEELALLFQSYTMKPGVRPFGCSLIICSENGSYRIDPPGVVMKLDTISYCGRGDGETFVRRMKDLLKRNSDGRDLSLTDIQKMIMGLFREEYSKARHYSNEEIGANSIFPTILFAAIDGRQNRVFMTKDAL
jgi:20S proteasome subunit alpha 2